MANFSSKSKDLIECLAAIEHDQWVFWSQEITKELDALSESLLDVINILNNIDCDDPIPADTQARIDLAYQRLHAVKQRLERWERLWCAYAKLTETEKEQDRVWARKVITIIEGEKQ